jgi:hypothetical protein
MKKIFLIISVALLASCKKGDPTPIQSECDCYKQYQQNYFGYYENTSQGEVVQDSCSLDGQIVDFEPYKRYIWICE